MSARYEPLSMWQRPTCSVPSSLYIVALVLTVAYMAVRITLTAQAANECPKAADLILMWSLSFIFFLKIPYVWGHILPFATMLTLSSTTAVDASIATLGCV